MHATYVGQTCCFITENWFYCEGRGENGLYGEGTGKLGFIVKVQETGFVVMVQVKLLFVMKVQETGFIVRAVETLRWVQEKTFVIGGSQ